MRRKRTEAAGRAAEARRREGAVLGERAGEWRRGGQKRRGEAAAERGGGVKEARRGGAAAAEGWEGWGREGTAAENSRKAAGRIG